MPSIHLDRHETVNHFRKRRALLLRKKLDEAADRLGRPLVIVDIGGRPDYWMNLPHLDRIERIDLLNAKDDQLQRPLPEGAPAGLFTRTIGDARHLADFADQSVDFIHSNSVIEHVGGWIDMKAMADELMRVGQAGWVQTPAWSFPLEPHFHTPFMHWFGAPMRARMLSLSMSRRYRRMDLARRRQTVEKINLLTRPEVEALFPDTTLVTERVALLAKSYVVFWQPEGVAQDGRAMAAA